MTHYGTLRAWAFIAMLVGVFGMIAAFIGSIVWAFEVEGFWQTLGVLLHRTPRVHLHRDDPDRARAGDARDRRRRRHRVGPLDAMAEVLARTSTRPTRSSTYPAFTCRSSTSAISPSGAWSTSRAGAGRRTCSPIVGGEWCQARHVGFIISGRLGTEFADGTSAEFGPGDVFDIPPGHDGFTVGAEPVRAGRVDRAACMGRIPDGHPQPGSGDAPLLGSRRLDDARRRARRRALARASLRALRGESRASSSGSAEGRSTRPVTGCSRGSRGLRVRSTARRRCTGTPRSSASRSG